MTHRFFVAEDPVDDVVVGGDQARQIASVLRLVPGDRLTLVRDGIEALVVLDAVAAREVRGHVVERRPVDAEPRVRLTLAVPLLKGERTAEVIEATTQLGVVRFVPFVASRSVVRDLAPAKLERWRRIARESAETARRGRIPIVDPAHEWDALFAVLEPPVVVAWEGAVTARLGDIPATRQLSLVIGPEGGLSAAEVGLARQQGATAVSLGRRNLRSETAAIAAVAQLIAQLDV